MAMTPKQQNLYITQQMTQFQGKQKKISVPKGACEEECQSISNSTVFACGVRGTKRSLKVTSVMPRIRI